MGDMGDFWNDIKSDMAAESKARRANNRLSSAQLLRARGITFETKNDGAHLVVHLCGLNVDFWPGTGLWRTRKTNKEGRGVHSMLRHAEQWGRAATLAREE